MCMKKRTAGQFASRFLLRVSSEDGGPLASLNVSLTQTIAADTLEVEGNIFSISFYLQICYLEKFTSTRLLLIIMY